MINVYKLGLNFYIEMAKSDIQKYVYKENTNYLVLHSCCNTYRI